MGTSKDRDTGTPGPYAGIEGIAAGRGRALAAAGVPDRPALARQDPQLLYEKLKAAGATGLSPERVARWVAKARTLEGVAEAPPAEGDDRSAPGAEPPRELLEGWTRTAAFSLWFAREPAGGGAWRSIVYHEGGAGEWQVLEGVETWADWIAERAGLPGRVASSDAHETSEPEAPWPPGAPEHEPPEATEPEDVTAPSPRFELTAVDVSERVQGLPAIEATVRASLAEPVAAGAYHAHVQIVDADSGTPVSRAVANGSVTGGAFEIRCALPFPPPGLYRVQSLVALEPDGPPVQHDGPPFEVR
jgi:hypothetical protein